MGIEQDFQGFWKGYPRKVGKLAAEKAYRLVRKNGATMDEIRDGLERYLHALPDDSRFIPHPRTWLAQGRWMDQEKVTPTLEVFDWWDECKQAHDGVCRNRYEHGTAMKHGLLPSQMKASR